MGNVHGSREYGPVDMSEMQLIISWTSTNNDHFLRLVRSIALISRKPMFDDFAACGNIHVDKLMETIVNFIFNSLGA